ncbi:class I SAM-dependent methyltransferase [Bdellovibrio sp. NC01]|uniref:class I SAM-dependent DNA methyltransferase n=1 Tax=Bdellovibrio sp. NC01 TaxID=2220073 RepID=UPI00143CE76D|nr:class I SAM-dependent methyltransferase [Bdellovibrio sp. NC01]
MKAYYHEHENAYRQIKQKGLVGWGNARSLDELGDDLTKRYVTETVQKHFANPSAHTALDLGCGTGTTAFILAKLGFQVLGVDVSETAIEMAKELTAQQGLQISYAVTDILDLSKLQKKFDLIYDSHCLHCIVFEEDRKAVFNGIQNILRPGGIFILDTMAHSPDMNITGTFDTLRFDENYILWHKTSMLDRRGLVEIDGQHWCAQRRVYPKEILLKEVADAGFKVVSEFLEEQSDKHPSMLRLVLSL